MARSARATLLRWPGQWHSTMPASRIRSTSTWSSPFVCAWTNLTPACAAASISSPLMLPPRSTTTSTPSNWAVASRSASNTRNS